MNLMLTPYPFPSPAPLLRPFLLRPPFVELEPPLLPVDRMFGIENIRQLENSVKARPIELLRFRDSAESSRCVDGVSLDHAKWTTRTRVFVPGHRAN